MCGIAGWFGRLGGCDGPSLLSALRHRGPDGEGIWEDPRGTAGLVHARLAILDLSDTGAQPMTCSAGHAGTDGSWLVMNGEIYNFRQLRSELESRGERFFGQSDTEVVVRLLKMEGKAALTRLAGMFALAFYDSETGRGLIARDSFGIKGLYYTTSDDGIAFASEVHPLRPLVKPAVVNPAAARDMLMWGSVTGPSTIVDGILELPAGSVLEWDGKKSTLSRWYTIRFDARPAPADPATATRRALLESIERHLVSDVPVGVFLSGGIDSTAIVALTREVLGPSADIRTFSIGFDDPAFDESSTARRTADLFGTTHTEWRMSPDEGRAEICGYLGAMDQPTIDGFNTWCVSKLARREDMKVVLSGLGGDELFGGYSSFTRVPMFLKLYGLPVTVRRLIAASLDLAGPGTRWKRLAAYLKSDGAPLAAFHAQRGIFTESEARELVLHLTGDDPGAADWHFPGLPADMANAVSMLEMTRYMQNQLLRDSDVFAMAHGLELRVPFVDARLFESVVSIPSSVRLRAGKQLLLDAVPEIPEWIRNQPKRGFRFPFEQWMQGDFGDVLQAADDATHLPLVTWYRRWALAALLTRLHEGRAAAPSGQLIAS